MMDKAKLINLDFPLETIFFSINPAKISITKSVQQYTRGSTQAGAAGDVPGTTRPQYQFANPQVIKLQTMYLEGILVKKYSDILCSWCMPWGSLNMQMIKSAVASLSGRVNQEVNIPTLLFQWGPPMFGFVMKCKLKTVTMEFVRFSPLGTPTRMLISNLELEEVFDPLIYALQNPTSGGKPGRTSHTVTDGENLQHLSKRRYGHPQYWRALADSNGIDDPLRVRAGQNVYLPNTEEIVASGPSGR